MTVKNETWKGQSRIARRMVLFNTDKPGGSKEPEDPTPESIEAYSTIVSETSGKDMMGIDEFVKTMCALADISPEMFEKSWMAMNEDPEGAKFA